MPAFFYKAKLSPGKIIQGEIQADTQGEALNKLTSQGYFPLSVEEGSSFSRQHRFSLKKVSSRDIHIFTHQLAGLIGSGLTLLNALNIILEQTQNKYFKSILADAVGKVKDGSSFSDALSNWPNIFSQFFIAMIKSAEAGGNLEETLARLEDYSSAEQELRASIKGALAYPVFIAIVGALTIGVLLGFVIPRLIAMFEEMGQALPLPTAILIAISNFFKDYAWFILAALLTTAFIFVRRLKSPENRAKLDRLKLKLPLLGGIIQKIELSRLTHTLSTLLSSGIPLVSALNIAQEVVNNTVIRGEVKRFQDEIRKGGSLSASIKASRYFPVFMINIISIGEEAGSLEKSFLKVSDEYRKDAEQKLKALTRLLEPAMILVMGLVVGFIVLSMLLPIFQMNLIVR